MNATVTFSDPGLFLGKTIVKIGQVILAIVALGCGYMAFLASEGMFSGWNVEIDSDFQEFFSISNPDTILFYLFLGLALKTLFWLGFLTWVGRKI